MEPAVLTVSRSRPSPAAIGMTAGLGLAGWAVVIAWGASGWSRYLHHDGLAGAELAPAVSVAVFVAGWLAMLAAMMLPTTYPLVVLFDRMVAARTDRRRLLGLLASGYTAVWLAAGLAAYAADTVLHRAAETVPAIHDRPWVVAGAALAVAGLYQLSSLKERCLTQCRSARLVLMTGWRGRNPELESLIIGASHGWSCVSCCWALMAVMFGVGAGNLGWMLALAAAMTFEKTAPSGQRISRPLGIALLTAAVGIVAFNL